MTPSSLPLCASIGPRTQSPTAQTPSAPVRHSWSTLMKPRSSSSTPVPAAEQILRVGTPADRDDEPVDGERLLALGIGVGDLDGVARDRRAGHLGAQADVQALLLEVPQRLLGDLLVGDRQEIRQRLEHDHLAAEPPPDAAQLEADHAGADDAEALRHGVEVERAPGIDDAAVPSNGAERSSIGAEPDASTTCLARELAPRAVVAP